MKQQDFKTPVKKAKNLGAGKSGARHWWMQRVTAIFLLPIIAWFIFMTTQLAGAAENSEVEYILRKDYNILGLMLMIGLLLYHGYLGTQVIIEDYIKCEMMRTWFILGVQFVSLVSFAAGILAVLKLYL
jgi:succinate dehydrogenase / fumarate reductase membrane anchor subunit